MHLWRKLVSPQWLAANEPALRSAAGDTLAIVEQPARRRLTLEIVCETPGEARRLMRNFGGRIEKIPRDWLERFSRAEKRPPLRVGRRLVIANAEGFGTSRRSLEQGAARLVIPAGVAFGTGEHVTTAMSLRFLEEITRKMKSGWSMADLGTGSGILALAARRFGARRILAVDNDACAIVTARANARLNKIGNIEFQIADVCRWHPQTSIDVLVANLFSELLIEILPKLRANLKPDGRLILSGVLRTQERELNRALRLNRMGIIQARRRGKWLALLAQRLVPG